MVYACRICQYDEKVENQCVYRNDLLTVTKCVEPSNPSPLLADLQDREQVGVTTDLGIDATLVCLFPQRLSNAYSSLNVQRPILIFHVHSVVTTSGVVFL